MLRASPPRHCRAASGGGAPPAPRDPAARARPRRGGSGGRPRRGDPVAAAGLRPGPRAPGAVETRRDGLNVDQPRHDNKTPPPNDHNERLTELTQAHTGSHYGNTGDRLTQRFIRDFSFFALELSTVDTRQRTDFRSLSVTVYNSVECSICVALLRMAIYGVSSQLFSAFERVRHRLRSVESSQSTFLHSLLSTELQS